MDNQQSPLSYVEGLMGEGIQYGFVAFPFPKHAYDLVSQLSPRLLYPFTVIPISKGSTSCTNGSFSDQLKVPRYYV